MPFVDVNFVRAQLLKIPQALHKDVMQKYLAKYDMMNPENRGLDAPIFANNWLKTKADKYSEKTAEFG